MKIISVVLATLFGLCSGYDQVHVALGKTTDVLVVSWASYNNTGDSEVMWGLSPSSLNSNNVGDSRAFTVDANRTWYTRTAAMTGLDINTRYYYKVGAGGSYSTVYSVMNRDMTIPHKHIMFGDMGAAASFTLCDACTQGSLFCTEDICKNRTVGLVSETETADMFLHVGDFAYNLEDNNGTVGDQFFNNIEQVAARVPYMISHGNHENKPGNLAHFIERFRGQPSNAVPPTFTTLNGESTNTLYFSWDQGLVHYISFSTELWGEVGDDKVNKTSFLKWLVKDLEKANTNRDAVPWVLVHGHRPLYWSENGTNGTSPMKQDLEDIFFNYGVDFSINGHVHNYERTWPTYKGKSDQSNLNPRATIYVVTGAAGCREMHSPFKKPQPSWSAYRSNSFSYTRMMVYNSSHIHWQQVQTDPTEFPQSDYGRVIDDVWIVQDRHGPFNASEAPKKVPTSCPPPLCGEYDHFTPLLGLGDSKPTWQLVQEFRAEHGEEAWSNKLKSVLKKLQGDMWEEESLDKKERSYFTWAEGEA
eukprot:TRINITY_DN41_c0_g2_i1.p1 TRINITY_DN41_c0_g2~~TRINITY_DN41_c0_g2_i1.p1  ORF type:complete len:530 (+),score=144.80 TRINITY_DN41_c0_g2_i1:44-1633(+)